ncbi:MAG: hypothetical protein RR348_01150 [Clostridia bacterium]
MKKNNFCGQNGGNNSNFYSKFAYNASSSNKGGSVKSNSNANASNASMQGGASTQNDKDFKNFYDKYSNCDEDSLMNTMFDMAKNAKQNGQLDNASLEEFYKSTANMLNAEQRKKLRKLVDMIKD